MLLTNSQPYERAVHQLVWCNCWLGKSFKEAPAPFEAGFGNYRRSVSKKAARGASVTVKEVDSKEAAKIRRKSKGFCGYDWMIKSIRDKGVIEA